MITAVCSNEYTWLPGLIQQLAKLFPSEDILIGSGVGHLTADRHLWVLAGHTVQRRAAALQSKWRLAFRQERAVSGPGCAKAPPEPLAGQRVRQLLAIVRVFEQESVTCLPDASQAMKRASSVKVALMVSPSAANWLAPWRRMSRSDTDACIEA